MTTSELTVLRQPTENDLETDTPLPVFVCWMIWSVAAVLLWSLVLTPFFI